MYYHDGMFGGMHIIWWLIWIAIIVWFLFLPSGRRSIRRKDTPLEILQRRYAKGEITKEEYEERRKTLTENS